MAIDWMIKNLISDKLVVKYNDQATGIVREVTSSKARLTEDERRAFGQRHAIIESTSGGISIALMSSWFYTDQALAIAEAIIQVVQDRKDYNAALVVQWFKDHGDDTEHHGFKADLSINAAKKLLAEGEIRIKEITRDESFCEGTRTVKEDIPLIKYNGEWLSMGRTDLKDDVRTTHVRRFESVEEVREYYMGAISYGARISANSIAFIDSLSDG